VLDNTKLLKEVIEAERMLEIAIQFLREKAKETKR
jgi:hypothetical protein